MPDRTDERSHIAAMACLPPIDDDSARWLLPLSVRTENRLVAVLLGDEGQRRKLLIRAIQADASFSLWALIQLHRRDVSHADTVELLADALVGVIVELLATGESLVGIADRVQWRALHNASLSVAREAAQGCAIKKDRSAAMLLGLVHNAESWFQLSQSSDTSSHSDATSHRLLPEWLQGQLASIRDNAVSDPIPLAVRLAFDAERSGEMCESKDTIDTCEATCLPTLAHKLSKLDTLEARFAERLESEKLASLQQFAYGLSHEINNPLANIATRSQTLLRDESDPERRRKLNTINLQAFRAHEMIADVMLFAKPPAIDKQRIQVGDMLEEVVRELQDEADQQETCMTLDVPADLTLLADRDHLAVALRAVCVNSLQAIGSGGSLEIAAKPARVIPGRAAQVDAIAITIRDDGPGITPEIRRHLFDPYFSGREAGRGLGVGLSKCWRVVELHDGKIEVTSSEGAGTTFTIYLPAV